MKLEVCNLKKSFSDKEVLHGLSFEVESGQVLGLLGRNGAGKTTTIRILMDVFKASKGEILLDGKPFIPKEHQIGYLPEERGLYPKKKVAEQLAYLGELRGLTSKKAKANTSKWLEKLGVKEFEKRKLETLSKGNQQKVQLAQTLVCDPDIVILDEPFSGLDPVNSQILKDIINELVSENKLVIFSSHQMGYVEEFCHDIVILKEGESVLQGNLKQIKREFGKNRLILSAHNFSLEELKSFCQEVLFNFIKVYEMKRDFLVVELNEHITKKDLLAELLRQEIDIERFAVYEPLLTDIFVLKAGDEA